MRYGLNLRAGPRILRDWSNSRYREIMLAAMAIELILLFALVIVDLLSYLRGPR